MTFDLSTLMAAGVLTTALAGALTGIASLADRGVRALRWWAAGYLVMALAIGILLATQLHHGKLETLAGMAFLSLGAALLWVGARRFGERGTPPAAVAAGPALVVAAFPLQADLPHLAVALHFAVTTTYFALTAAALWPCRKSGLRFATPLIGFVVLHAAVFAAGTIEALFDLLPPQGLVGFHVVFSAIHFEQMIFAMGSSIFLVAMVREQSEQGHRDAAAIDALTGLATRREFLKKAEDELAACLERGAPLAVLMFDLDNFKRINDAYGHAVGDRVLQNFAHVARLRLRQTDVIGRLGGEEFAAVMPGSSLRVAAVIAERIRRAFAEMGCIVDGQPISTTVSGGIAAAHADLALAQLLLEADAALYRAKANGRNRIEVSGRIDGDGGDTVVIRVA